MTHLPACQNLLHQLDNGVLTVTFNRPDARNAMSVGLLTDICNTFAAIKADRTIRAVVLRGAGGNFCAGGDIKEMAAVRAETSTDGSDPLAAHNRKFGTMLQAVNAAPQATIAVLEGAVLGGGFGLACVTDIAIARKDANFGLPETGLGIMPAQISPFVVQRIGLSQARRLGVCGARFDGTEALRLGLVHYVVDDDAQLQTLIDQSLTQIRRCAPGANAATKEIMLWVGQRDMNSLLDDAAAKFAAASRGPEAAEGAAAFIQKRKPSWA